MTTITDKITEIEANELGTTIAAIFAWVRYDEIQIKNQKLTIYMSMWYLIVWFLSFRMRKSTLVCIKHIGIEEVKVKWRLFLAPYEQ